MSSFCSNRVRKIFGLKFNLTNKEKELFSGTSENLLIIFKASLFIGDSHIQIEEF